jgi:hypothetical protein
MSWAPWSTKSKLCMYVMPNFDLVVWNDRNLRFSVWSNGWTGTIDENAVLDSAPP